MSVGSFSYRKLLTYASADKQPLLERTRDQLSEVNSPRQSFILLFVYAVNPFFLRLFCCLCLYFFTRTMLSFRPLIEYYPGFQSEPVVSGLSLPRRPFTAVCKQARVWVSPSDPATGHSLLLRHCHPLMKKVMKPLNIFVWELARNATWSVCQH